MSEAAGSEIQRIKVEGLIFNAPMPYKAGHVLLENEAGALNQTHAENLRNNFAKKVKAFKEEAAKNGGSVAENVDAPEELQTEFTAYANDYEFGSRRVAGSGDASLPKDPVMRQAHINARNMIRVYAKAKGQKVDAEQVNAMVPGLLAKRPDILEEAKRQVEANSNISLEDLGLEIPPKKEESTGEAGSTGGEATSDQTADQTAAAEDEASKPRRSKR